MNLMNKIRTLLALPISLFFCLWYLPFSQAIKIPIILYNPKLYCIKGKVIINATKIRFGMIRLGLFITNQYPNNGISFYNKGTILFKGDACIGANSAITVLRHNSYVEIGERFGNSSTLRINCDYRIILYGAVRCGCNVQIMDSAMHRLKNKQGLFVGRGYDEVIIGSHTWLATDVTVMQGTKLPPYSVVAARSLCNQDYSEHGSYGLYAGIPAKYKKSGRWRDINDDSIIIENE